MDPPFHDHPSFIAYLVRNMQRKQDNIILYDGEEGSGKSNAALWDALLIHEAMKRKPFNPGADPIITPDDWQQRFDAGEKERVYHFDEFENFAFSRNFNTFQQKGFVLIAQQIRILRSTWLCCMPYGEFSDVYFRTGRFKLRVALTRVTDYDVQCPSCGLMHEIREASYKWRQRTVDDKTGEVSVSWQEVFAARHCPLSLHRPEDWMRYEALKEAKVREAAQGRRRRPRNRLQQGVEPGSVAMTRGERRMAWMGEIRQMQDRMKAAGLNGRLQVVLPPIPRKRSNTGLGGPKPKPSKPKG